MGKAKKIHLFICSVNRLFVLFQTVIMLRCIAGRIIGGFGWLTTSLVLVCLVLGGFRVPAEPAAGDRLSLDPERIVFTGQFDPGTNWQTVTFETPAKGRYLCLNALSSQDDKPFAAVAELQMLDATGKLLDRDDWKIVATDSEELEGENGAATNAIDDKESTYWHTEWTGSPTAFPHRLILDLGRSVTLTGFRYLPRQGDPAATGRIKDFQISVGENLKEKASPDGLVPQKVFLFSYFTDRDHEGLHLAWSEDGYQWDPLNSGLSIYSPPMGGNTLMRDPCLLRGPDGIFRMVWTCAWGGNAIGYAESKDLIHWSEGRALPVMADETNVVNCWAPEVYWDRKRSEYLIIWASAVTNRFPETLTQSDQLGNQRIYFTTTKDFQTFTPTKLFYDPGFALIDPTLIERQGTYYLIFKDETTKPMRKSLRVAESDDMRGPFRAPSESFSPQWVEGPAVFATEDDVLCIFHFYSNNTWGGLRSKDLKTWVDVTDRFNLPPSSHSGTVLEVPREVLLALWRAGRAEIGPSPETVDLGIGHWIWADKTEDKQTCRLWRKFEVPSGALVSLAMLRITADNGYRVFLDGLEIGRGGDFNDLTEYNVTQLVTPGPHVLAVEGFNDALAAGVILGLQIQMLNGQQIRVLSDPSWLVVPTEEKNWTTRGEPKAGWKHAHIVAFAGKFDWARPKRILSSPPLLPRTIYFWQRGWFLFSMLSVIVVAVVFSIRQGLKLTVQTRSQKLLERERDRIARDIHDELGAGLTQLTLLGELVLRETPPGAATREQLDSLCGKTRRLLGTMDELVWTVNSRRDTVQDFAAFVCEYAQEFLSSTPIRCRLDVPDHLPPTPLDLPARRNLLLAVKEAVRNVAKHSGATELFLQIRVEDEKLVVTLEDNGVGFVAKTARSARNGLRNMGERLSDIGGVCRIAGAPEKGCRVVFSLPLHPPTLTKNPLAAWFRKILRRTRPTDSAE